MNLTRTVESTSLNRRTHVSLLWVTGRHMCRDLLAHTPCDRHGLEIAHLCEDVESARPVLQTSPVEVVVLDESAFTNNGHFLFDEDPIRDGRCRVAVFADRLSDARIEQAIELGVLGLFSMFDPLPIFASHVQHIVAGNMAISEALRSRVTELISGTPVVAGRALLASLTNRQLAVLTQLALGKSIKDIAAQLRLSEKAIVSHKFRLMARLGVHNRVELCRWAIREGVVEP